MKKIITNILVADSRVIQDIGLTVRLNALSSSSLYFMVRRPGLSRSDQQNATFDLLEKAKVALDTHNIGISYPQMDVHLYRTPKPQQEHQSATTATSYTFRDVEGSQQVQSQLEINTGKPS